MRPFFTPALSRSALPNRHLSMRTRPLPVRIALTVLVTAHLAISVLHGVAHEQAHVPLTLAASLLVYIVILAGPMFGLAMTFVAPRTGAWIVAATMAAAFVFGLVNHFLLDSPDHVAHVNPDGRRLFALTALLLAMTEALAVAVALRIAWRREPSRALWLSSGGGV